jgi:chromatin structure-remodeling complex protein RSC7
MWEAARRVHEMNTEWSKMRQEARTACGGILEANPGKGKEMNGAMEVDGEVDAGQKKKDAELPMGVYEPHTGLVHCTFEFVSFGVTDR